MGGKFKTPAFQNCLIPQGNGGGGGGGGGIKGKLIGALLGAASSVELDEGSLSMTCLLGPSKPSKLAAARLM